jgi:hypothetical protein
LGISNLNGASYYCCLFYMTSCQNLQILLYNGTGAAAAAFLFVGVLNYGIDHWENCMDMRKLEASAKSVTYNKNLFPE